MPKSKPKENPTAIEVFESLAELRIEYSKTLKQSPAIEEEIPDAEVEEEIL